MKDIFKATLAAALAGWLVGKLLRKLVSEQADTRIAIPPDPPKASPVRDAEPTVAEPLAEFDLRVAQNSPL
jgi:hypothetical protein